jgi:hypothetical protein
MKRSVRARTTITVGDSLGGVRHGDHVGVPINAPDITAFRSRHELDGLDRVGRAEKLNYPCTEAQYHGGLGMEDWDAVIVPKGVHDSPEFQRLKVTHLDPKGIPVIVDTGVPAGKWKRHRFDD